MRDAGMEDKPKSDYWLFVTSDQQASLGILTIRESMLLLVLPVLVSVAFLLIADIDSPRGGVICVSPQNLDSLAQSLP
jgi:hypothetical protein